MASTPLLPERTRFLTVGCSIAAFVLLSHPLQSVDLWWDLSRGREVLNGAIQPCRNLLTLDDASEAAWLGGVPFFALWSVGGIFGLAAVPFAAGFLLLSVVRRSAGRARWLSASVVALLLLVAVRGELEPVAGLFDLLGLLSVAAALRRWGTSRSLPVVMAVLFACWANLAPRPLWGLLLVTLWPGPVANRGRALLASLLGGLLTPRGPLTWLDSTVLFAPAAFVPSAELMEVRWRGAWGVGWNAPLVAGLLLWIVAVWRVWQTGSGRPGLIRYGMLLVPVIAVGLALQNLAVASLWTVLTWLEVGPETPEPRLGRRSPWLAPALIAAAALATADACGVLEPRADVMGWGVSQTIDPRLLRTDDVIPGAEPVNAWCADSRSAGLAAWACRKSRLVDHPVRALLSGRSRIHAVLRNDLLTAHQWRYRRDDGSWGGWARTLRDWKAMVLFISADDVQLHQALIETPWKLIKIDSPVAPYATAENPRFDPVVVDVMRQQSLVETGSWQPSIDVYDPQGWRFGMAEQFGGLPSSLPAVQQAHFFRAIQLPMAAVRSLGPVRAGGGTSAVRSEFFRCQEALTRDEWIAIGRASRFRRAVLASATLATTRESPPWLAEADEDPLTDRDWRKCLELYLDGRPVEAAAALTGMTPDDHYARGLLWVEAGEIERAREAFQAATSGDGAERIAAGYWLEQIAPAGNG